MNDFKSDQSLKPMKGAHLVCNDAILSFISAALDEIHEVGGFNIFDDRLDAGESKEILDELLEVEDWQELKDRFGRKVYKARPYAVVGQQEAKGELRVGVVVVRDTLMVDIRVWGSY